MADAIALPARLALLPANRTPYETAQSLTSAARRPLPAHLVKDVWNPATCPLDLIPYQCAGLGLEIWDDTWPEAKQREIYADLWRLKRNKTKLKGIKGYLDLVGAGLVAAHLPKQRMWWSGGQTQAQRDAAMAEMPRVRIYPFADPAKASVAKPFWGRFGWSKAAWMASDAAARAASRAVYVDGATTTPVTLRGIDGVLDASLRVELSAPASVAKPFWGRFPWARARSAWMASDAADHVLAITPSQDAASFAVPRGLVPTTVRPIRTSETVTERVGRAFWGRFAWAPRATQAAPVAWGGGAAWRASDAADHVYDEVVLFDPARAVATRQPYSFWGYTRFGRRPYTAELLLDVPLTRSPTQFGWGNPWGRATWGRSDMSPFWRAVEAVRVAKAFRDFVWISTELYQPIRFTAGLRFGDPGFGQFGDTRKLS